LNQNQVSGVELRKAVDNTVIENLDFQATVISDSSGKKYLSIRINLLQSYVGDEYYLAITTEFGRYYSEIFCVSQISNSFIGIEWASSNGKVGEMVYFNDFKHSINIEAKIISSEPDIEEETEEDGHGNEVPTLQILKQGHELSFVVPNFIAQALSALPLHDKVNFINRSLGESPEELQIKNKYIEIKSKPEPDGCNSYVEMKYIDELVISTACTEELMALNNPPIADIVWDDTGTYENRNCNLDDGCSQTLRKSELTIDPDGNIESFMWQRSQDNGNSWSDLGPGDTKTVNELSDGNYQYRLKVTDSFGLEGFSNILRYRVLDISQPSTPQLQQLDTLGTFCSTAGGIKIAFNIQASDSQTIRSKFLVNEYFGSGFVLTVIERNTQSVLLSWTGGPVGTNVQLDFDLNSNGLGEYEVELCLNECSGTSHTQATVEITLLDTDMNTETDQNIIIERYFNCQ